jgi:hypothetical protein
MWGHSTYLILILVWAGPVIVMQWLVGVDLLIRRWKVLIPGILLPTLYLAFIDSFALRSGTWTISPSQSLDIFVPLIHVPIEEAAFFLVTNTLIIQGMILFQERSHLRARVGQILTIGKRPRISQKTSQRKYTG